MLRLTAPLPDGYAPAQLLHSSNLIQTGTELRLAGYGPPTLNNPHLTLVLRDLLENIDLSDSEEGKSNGSAFGVRNTITGVLKGSSEGDSGGPAYLISDNSFAVAGVCSAGQAYSGNQFSSYESVPFYYDWIVKAANDLGATAPTAGL